MKKIKQIKQIVHTAFNKSDAMDMLEGLRILGNISEGDYQKGRELIRKEFPKNEQL